MDYLKELIKRLGNKCSDKSRSSLGKLFGIMLDKQSIDPTLDMFNALLSDSSSDQSTAMRSHIMRILTLLSGPFSFMIPTSLSKLISTIQYIGINGLTSLVGDKV